VCYAVDQNSARWQVVYCFSSTGVEHVASIVAFGEGTFEQLQ